MEKQCKDEDEHATQTKNELEIVHAQVSKAETEKKKNEKAVWISSTFHQIVFLRSSDKERDELHPANDGEQELQ